MVYKRWITKNGKKHGPYYYETYRGKDGKTHSRYLPNYKPKRAVTKKNMQQNIFSHKTLFIVLILAMFLIIGGIFYLNYKINYGENEFSDSGFSFKALTKGVYGFLTGHTTEEVVESSEDSSESSDSGGSDAKSESSSESSTDSSNEISEVVESDSSEENLDVVEDSEEILEQTEEIIEDNLEDTMENTEEVIEGEENSEEIQEEIDSNETIVEINETEDFENINGTESEKNETESGLNQTNEQIVGPEKSDSGGSVTDFSNFTDEFNITNETIENFTQVEIVNETLNFTTEISIKQYSAVLGKPVKWQKKVKINLEGSEKTDELKIQLPDLAGNISVKKKTNLGEEEIEVNIENEKIIDEVEPVVEESKENPLDVVFNFFLGFFKGMTGNIVGDDGDGTFVDVVDEVEDGDEILIEYYTEAPYAEEILINNKTKQIQIIGPDEIEYENILSFTELPIQVRESSVKLYVLENGGREEVEITKYDLDNNSLVDFIEWVVPYIGDQIYELEILLGENVRVIVKLKKVSGNVNFYGEKEKEFKLKGSDVEIRVLNEELLAELENSGFVEKVVVDQPVSILLEDSEEIIKSNFVRENFSLTGAGEKICVLDTGVDYGHEDIVNFVDGWDFVNNDSDVIDDQGHGTNVAGVVSRVAPGSELYIAKVIDENGEGYESDVLQGLEWCIDQNSDIIIFSIGAGNYSGYCDENIVAEFVNEVVSDGVLVVAATGNDGTTNLKSPACASQALRVAATDKQDEIAEFSNVNSVVDVLAPGVGVEVPKLGGGTELKTGTSISSPMVGAAAALVLENESLNPAELKYRLSSTGKPISYFIDFVTEINISRIDVYNAVINNVTMIPYNETFNETNETGDNETFFLLTDCGISWQNTCANGESCCNTADACSAGAFIGTLKYTCQDCDYNEDACGDCCWSSGSTPSPLDYCTGDYYTTSFIWGSTAEECCGDDGAGDTWCDAGFTGCGAGTWYDDADDETSGYICEDCGGGTYESYWTVASDDCCGDDSGEDKEGTNSAGQKCCYNAAALADGEDSGSIMCSNGYMYDCDGAAGDDGADGNMGTPSDGGDVVEGKYCDADSNTWVALKSNGASCSDGFECTSTYCVDGVCCNSACSGTCYACDIDTYDCLDWPAISYVGTCTAIHSGCDLDNECANSGYDGCSGDCTKTASNNGYCDGAGACGTTSTSVSANKICSSGSEVDADVFTACDSSVDYWSDARACTYTKRYAECDGSGSCDTDSSNYYELGGTYDVPADKVGEDQNGGTDSTPYIDASSTATACDNSVDYWASARACEYSRRYAECDGSGSCDTDSSDNYAGSTVSVPTNKVAKDQSGGTGTPYQDASSTATSCDNSVDYWASARGCTYTRRYAECNGFSSCDTDASNNYQGTTYNVPANKVAEAQSGGTDSTPYIDASSTATACDNSVDYWATLGFCNYSLRYAECNGGGSCDTDSSDYYQGSTVNVPANKTAQSQNGGSSTPYDDATSQAEACDYTAHNSCSDYTCSGSQKFAECDGSNSCDTSVTSNYQAVDVYAEAGYSLTSECGTTGVDPCNSAWECTSDVSTDDLYTSGFGYFTQGFCDGTGDCDYSGLDITGDGDNSSAACECKASGTQGTCDDGESDCWENYAGDMDCCTGVDSSCDGSNFAACVLGVYRIDADNVSYGETVCGCGGGNWTANGDTLNCCGDDAGEASPYEVTETSCGDGNDNDCDGDVDGDDEDCDATPSVILNSPEDDYLTSRSVVIFNATVSDDIKLDNVSLWGNWTTWEIKETNSSGLNSDYIFTINLSSEGTGVYLWRISATDNSSKTNYSENRTFIYNETAPLILSPIINSSDGTNLSSQDLNCYDTLLDDEADEMNVSVKWYKDGDLNLTLNYNENFANGTLFVSTLDSGNTSIGDVWNCSVQVYDGQLYSGWGNSSTLTILEAVPNITSYSPLSTPFSIAEPNNQTFSIIYTNESAVKIEWFVNDSEETGYENNSEFLWEGNFSQEGIYEIKVNISNGVGSDSQTWIMAVNDTASAIGLDLIYPTGNVNVVQNNTFYVRLNVTCLGDDCGTVNVSLDPVSSSVENVSYTYMTSTETCTTECAVNMDVGYRVDEGYTHSNPSIFVNSTGTYKVFYSCTFIETSSDSRSNMRTWLEVDGVEVPQSKSYTYIRGLATDEDETSASAVVLVNMSDGEKLELHAIRDDGGTTPQTIDDCWIYMSKVDLPAVMMYDVNGGENVAGGDSETATLDTVYYQDSSVFTSDTTNNWITVDETGWYRIYYHTCVDSTTGKRAIYEAQLQKNGAIITPSQTRKYTRDTNTDECMTGSLIYNFTANDNVSLYLSQITEENDESANIHANTSWIVIEQLPDTNFLMVYDAGAEQEISVSGEESINFDTNYYLDSEIYTHASDAEEIYINETGWYEIMYWNMFNDHAIGARHIACSKVKLNGDTDLESRACTYTRGLNCGTYGCPNFSSSGGVVIYNFTEGDYIELVTDATGGDEWTVPGASWVAISKIYNDSSSSSTKSGLVSTTPGATPFYTNASTNPLTTSSLDYGDSELVTFWVNATGEINSTHEFFAYANTTVNMSISNITSTWNVTIVDAPVNQSPNDPSPVLVSVDGTNSTLSDLNCSDVVSDPEADSMNATVRWYKNGALNLTVSLDNDYANNSLVYSILDSGNLTEGDSWLCSMMLTDGVASTNSSWVNSSVLSVVYPSINLDLIYPSGNVNVTQNEFFNVTLNISCAVGECGAVNVSLDPDNWWNESWVKRKEINITGVGSLSNFPVYLNVSKQSEMQSDFDDLRFLNGSCSVAGGSLLDYEIENYTSSLAHVWVRLPSVSAGVNQICMYYNNSGAANGEDAAGVWDDDYVGVWHFGLPRDSQDSSSNNNDGSVQSGVSNYSAGYVDGCYDFDGSSNSHIDISQITFSDNVPWSVEYWFYHDDASASDMSMGDSDDVYNRFYHRDTDTYKIRFHTNGGSYVDFDFGSNLRQAWHHVFVACNGEASSNNFLFYVDGAYVETESIADTGFLIDTIGNAYTSSYDWNGMLDEVRISNINRSQDWINQSYQLEANQASYVVFGAVENYSSSGTKSGLVSTTPGTIPFYTNASTNPLTTSSLDYGDSELVTFWVNATGEINSTHEFFAYANTTANMSISNITSTWNVTIVEASEISIAIDLSDMLTQQINWTLASLPVFNQSAEGNNGEGASEYYVNVSVTGGTADLYMKANDDLRTSGADVLDLGNETYSYNSTNSSVPGETKTSLTKNFADNKIGDSLTGDVVVYLKFFLSAPAGQAAGSYNNTLFFKAVEHGLSP